jgi:hypothetical protein
MIDLIEPSVLKDMSKVAIDDFMKDFEKVILSSGFTYEILKGDIIWEYPLKDDRLTRIKLNLLHDALIKIKTSPLKLIAKIQKNGRVKYF